MTPQEKILIFKGTEKQIAEVLQPLSLLPINKIDFMKKALRSNLNNLQVEENIYLNRLKEQYKKYSVSYSRGDKVYYYKFLCGFCELFAIVANSCARADTVCRYTERSKHGKV